MRRGPNEVRGPADSSQTPYLVALCAMGALLVVWLGGWAVAQVTGTGHGSPVEWTKAWVSEAPAWSAAATVACVCVTVLLAAAAVMVERKTRDWRWKREQLHGVDRMAPKVARRSDERALRENACVAFAQRIQLPAEFAPGLPLGTGVAFKKPLFMNYELTAFMIAGPRQGKSAAIVVPQTVGHAGPVLLCSNKRDVHDLTRGPRSQRGMVWVHDMQQIAQQEPTWWWDPLSFIRAGEDQASRAARLAGAWQACHSGRDAKGDAYFGPGGETLLANLLLVAALKHLPVSAAILYMQDLTGREVNLPEPVEVLHEHGFDEMASQLKADRDLTAKQLDGLVGTARGILSFLREPRFREWITPQPGRSEFDPATFVTTSDTLLLLSKNEAGSSGRAIITALTMAVTDAGIRRAQREPGGRLSRPLLLMLDEAANICPWPELPDLYSYLGSHGIVPVTILQNKAQGVKAWGADGMDQLVSSANVMLVGGGINETKHLRELVDLIGQRQEKTSTKNRGYSFKSHSVGHQTQWRDIFTVAQMAAWPEGRLIAFTPGARPIILRTHLWFSGPDKDVINESKAYYEPAGTTDHVGVAEPVGAAETSPWLDAAKESWS